VAASALSAADGFLKELPKDPDNAEALRTLLETPEELPRFLRLGSLYVANEGKPVAIVSPDTAASLVAKLSAHPLGSGATHVGRVTAQRPGLVALKTALGGTRVVETQVGEQLPRPCETELLRNGLRAPGPRPKSIGSPYLDFCTFRTQQNPK